ncbi:hypothetical protein ACWDTT_10690 [Streptosporangium sandarakinum]|uniref:hypothetical protein n=1 Tax=Streptosporangium nondiastaticum TaxID=35764 RepID=UPI0031F7B5B8
MQDDHDPARGRGPGAGPRGRRPYGGPPDTSSGPAASPARPPVRPAARYDGPAQNPGDPFVHGSLVDAGIATSARSRSPREEPPRSWTGPRPRRDRMLRPALIGAFLVAAGLGVWSSGWSPVADRPSVMAAQAPAPSLAPRGTAVVHPPRAARTPSSAPGRVMVVRELKPRLVRPRAGAAEALDGRARRGERRHAAARRTPEAAARGRAGTGPGTEGVAGPRVEGAGPGHRETRDLPNPPRTPRTPHGHDHGHGPGSPGSGAGPRDRADGGAPGAPGASARDGRDAPAGPAGPGGHGGPGGVGLRFDAAYACRNFREDDWRHDFCVRAWNDYRGRNGLP